METSLLEIIDNPKHSTKKELRPSGFAPKKCPPRLSAKRNFNRCLFTNRPTMLMNDENNLNGSSMYDDSLSISYFDQCFDLISRIGEGSYGEVYKVRSKEDGRYYAVKRSRDSYRGPSDRENKITEVRNYQRIPEHPNIISLVNAWEQDDYVYVQMELGDHALDSYVEEHPDFTESHLWNILLDMLLALNSLHERNLVHLDVKLENIIIFDDGTCKLADFNIAINVKDDLNFACEGDAKYLPPELLEGKFTKAADVFSLGISMLELASNLVLPVNGKLWHDLRNLNFPTHIIKDVPKELLNIIKRMMAKDFKKRPSVKCLLRHPRFKSLMKQRRIAAEDANNRLTLNDCMTPPIRTSTPIPTTPPRNENNNYPLINVIQVTPPVGYSTPNIHHLLNSYDNSLNTSMEAELHLQEQLKEDELMHLNMRPQRQQQIVASTSAKKLFKQ